MGALVDWVARTGRALSPRGRQWRRFLSDLPLDPNELERPLRPPGPRDFIICGCARTGTSLLAAALFQPPQIATVMEPWDGMRLPPAELFGSLRREIAETGRLGRGRLDLRALDEEGAVRWTSDRGSPTALDLGADYTLGVKWPVFWRYLDLLPETKFLVCLRDPIEVMNSFKEAGGRVALGLHYATAFNREMNAELSAATEDIAERRVLLYDYIHHRILPHLDKPNVLAVRYERWANEPEALRAEISAFLDVEVGPLRPVIVPPKPVRLSEGEMELVVARCSTAEALGYRLGSSAGTGATHVRTERP